MKSIISLKSIKSIALTTKKVVVIDFCRLTVSVDINENVIIDNYRITGYWLVFRYLFLSTALVRPCRNRTGDHGAWLAWNLTVFLPFLHSSLVWNNLFQIKYMIDSKNVVGLEIPIGFEFIFWKPKKKLKAILSEWGVVERDWNWGHQSTIAQMSWRPSTPLFGSNRYFAVFTEKSFQKLRSYAVQGNTVFWH